jgi:hypothetical protein
MTARRFVLLALSGALATLGGLWLVRAVSAQELILTVSEPRVLVGQEQGVSLEAGGMSERGLGAWTIDLMYNPDLLEPTSCNVGSLIVCNPDYAEGTIRIAGASTETFLQEGNFSIAHGIFFKCLAPGEAELTLVPRILVDQTLGDPQPIDAAVRNASFVCEAAAAATPTSIAATPTAFPHVGAGGHPGSDDLLHALIALMSGIGIAAMITFALLVLRARRL